jgi:hypothetical protein
MSENFLDMGDKELDEFLKKISDDAEIPFSEEDWEAMESRLDESVKPRPTVWKRNILLGALVLLLAGMITYFVWDQEGVIPFENPKPSMAELPKSAMKEGSIKEDSTTIEAEILLTQEAPIREAVNTIQSSAINPASVSLWDQNNKKATDSPTRAAENFASADLLTVASGDAFINSETIREEIRNSEESALALSASSRDSTGLSSPALNDFKEKEKKTKGQFGGKFNISFQVAPDLSAIQLDHFGKAGNMIGLGAEYFVLPKVSLSSGVFYSYKPYSGDSGYHLNYGKTPAYIIGVCDILDIPLNLRFYALEGKVQRFFISAGVSTYLMLKEKYELEYYNQNTGEPYFREIKVQGANQHYFGIVNISVGYERKLGRQLGIQVEPYFKVPFSGVGEGDVSLKSTGIFVGLKYYPGKR